MQQELVARQFARERGETKEIAGYLQGKRLIHSNTHSNYMQKDHIDSRIFTR